MPARLRNPAESRTVALMLNAVDESGRLDQDIVRDARVGPSFLSLARTGRVSSPGVHAVESVLAVLGLQVTVEKLAPERVDPVTEHSKRRRIVWRHGGFVVPARRVNEWRKLRDKGFPPEEIGTILGLARLETPDVS